MVQRVIHFVGPGAAGKSTVGRALAPQLGVAFIDLDDQFKAQAGDISGYLDAYGYEAYAAENVRAYLATDVRGEAVFALSSGLMTYRSDVHCAYEELRAQIAVSPSTFVLLASVDYELCVRETVGRQLTPPFNRSAERDEEVIRHRFRAYSQLPAKKVETLQSIHAVVDSLHVQLQRTIGTMKVAAFQALLLCEAGEDTLVPIRRRIDQW